MLMRLLDFLKGAGITAIFVSLTGGGDDLEKTMVGISSLTDTWILLRDLESNGERNRIVYVLKSRGMAHSNQLREFVMTSRGIKLIPAYVGPGGVLTGSSRLSQEAKEKSDTLLRQQESQRRQLEISRRRVALQAQIASLQSEFEAVEQEARQSIREEEEREEERKADVANMVRSRRSR